MQSGLLDQLTLTPKSRMIAALRGQPVDRIPVWLMRQAGRYLPEYQAVRSKFDFLSLCRTPEAAAEVSIQPIEIIDSDAVIIFNDILIPLEAMGAQVEFGEKGPRITNPLRSEKDLAGLKSRELSTDEPVAETIRTVRRRLGNDFPILGFIGAPWTLASYWIEGVMTRNFESALALRWGQPELLDKILERITETALAYLRLQIKAGADAVQIFDTWGSALRQSDYERFSGQYIRKIIAGVRDLGVPVIVYLNGCAPYLDSLNSLGADCVSVDWRIELSAARAALTSPSSIQGNLDPLVLYTNPSTVEAAVRELFEKFPPRTGHVFNLGHGILPKTPVENAKKLVEAVKKYGAH